MEDIISSIASLWPVLLILLITLIVIMFRVQIKTIISKREFKIKKGDTEFEVKYGNENIEKQKEYVTKATLEETSATLVSIDVDKIDQPQNGILKPEEPFRKLLNAYVKTDMELMEVAYEEMQNDENDNFGKVVNKAMFLKMKFDLGDTNALNDLKKLEIEYKQTKIHKDILRYIGNCYKETNKLEDAIKIFYEAENQCENSEDKSGFIISIVGCYLGLNKRKDAFDLLIGSLQGETNANALFKYYKELAEYYKLTGEEVLKAFALEKALEFKPNDTDVLFNAAYNYPSHYFNDLTILHYKNLIGFDKNNSNALNNLGVAYDLFDLCGLKISSYKKSIKLKNTLAYSNIAYKLMDAGFFDKAIEYLNEAKKEENFHQNVGRAFSELADRKLKESEKEKDIIDFALAKQRYIREYSDAYFNRCNVDINLQGIWAFENGVEIEINQDDKIINAEWQEHNIQSKFEGELINRAGIINILGLQYDFSQSKYLFKKNGNGYLYLLPDNNSIHLMLFKDGNSSTLKGDFKKLNKVLQMS